MINHICTSSKYLYACNVFVLQIACLSYGCASNPTGEQKLDNIGFALLGYQDTVGRMPPLLELDADGNPMHSWRVWLPPYIEANSFHATYDFSVAWNLGSNAGLADGTVRLNNETKDYPASIRTAFQSQPLGSDHETSFVAIVHGELSTERYRHGTRIYLGDTMPFIIVELRRTKVHWMEPKDMELAPTPFDMLSYASNRDLIVRSIVVSDRSIEHLDRDATLAMLDQMR